MVVIKDHFIDCTCIYYFIWSLYKTLQVQKLKYGVHDMKTEHTPTVQFNTGPYSTYPYNACDINQDGRARGKAFLSILSVFFFLLIGTIIEKNM